MAEIDKQNRRAGEHVYERFKASRDQRANAGAWCRSSGSAVNVAPYWGPISQTPVDRRLREKRGAGLQPDGDVANLRAWLEKCGVPEGDVQMRDTYDRVAEVHQ